MKLRTNIYLEEGQAAALDQAARAQGISRAELVRQLIDRGIAGSASSDVEADLAALEASFGTLTGDDAVNVIARGPDDRSRHLQRAATRRTVRR
jgi:Ribbon-helix-helix protein, copG family